MKGQKILKVTSILMIIGGVIGVVAGILAILGISALAALSGSTEGIGLLYASSIIVTVASVIQFIAGIKGVGACSDSQKAASCIKWGVLLLGSWQLSPSSSALWAEEPSALPAWCLTCCCRDCTSMARCR